MSSIATVLGFSWGYLRRYWVRLGLSILFGIIFALSNASFIWATRTLTGRFEAKSEATAAVAKPAQPARAVLTERFKAGRAWVTEAGRRMEAAVDPWLPRVGQPMDWRQKVGLLCFLPLLIGIRAASDYLNNY